MDEKLTEDLRFQFNSSCTSSLNDEHEDKGVLNFNHDGDSQNDIKDSAKQIIQSNCQNIHIGNKENDDDFDTENEDDFDTDNEDLLLCIKDGEGNFDEYEFTEEEENYLLREDCPEHYIKVGGMILWNADEYDFTDEQENILLSDDCPSDYLKSLRISNLNKVYTVDDEDKLLCVDLIPSSLNQNMVRVQEDKSSYISCSSNRNSSGGKEHKNLSASADKGNEIIRDFSTIPKQQIKSKDLLYNSEIKSEIPSYFSDTMKKLDTVTNTDDGNITEIDIISDIEDFFMNEEDEDNSQSLYNPFFTEPAEITIPQENCFSSKIIAINSTDDGKDHYSEDSNTGEKVGDREFDVSKVMKSDSERRAYLNSLKDKTDSLLRFYSNFKSSFLQSPLRIIEELELNKSFSEEENVAIELCNDPKKMEIKSLNKKNVDVFPVTNKPLIIAVENKTVQSISQFNNQAENSVERVKRRLTFSMQNTDEIDLKQLRDSEEIQDETLEKIRPKSGDEYIKDILDKNASGASLEEKTFCSLAGVVCNIPKDVLSYGVIESRRSNISEAFSKEQQQNINTENLCDLQNFNMKDSSGLEKCFMPDQFSMKKEDKGDQERNVLNKSSQKFTGGKFTETLGSHLFVGYEAMDFQSTNDDSCIVSDEHDIEATTSMNLRKRPKLNYATNMNLRKRPKLNYSTSMNLRNRPKLN